MNPSDAKQYVGKDVVLYYTEGHEALAYLRRVSATHVHVTQAGVNYAYTLDNLSGIAPSFLFDEENDAPEGW